jgi:GMP synthase-like glutamine amidotransferase
MILVVDMNYKKDSLGFFEFVQPILVVASKLENCFVKHFLEVTEDELCRCDRVILSGTALKDTATLTQLEKFQWLKQISKPVLGICAGMETIGAVYKMQLAKSLEIGMTQIVTVKENPLAKGDFKAYSLHSICVEGSSEFEVWAKSEKCVQVIKHKQRQIYGVLFHPEVRNQEILTQFISIK